jgi:hypothetical protein
LCQSASLVNNVTGWRYITKVKVDRWFSGIFLYNLYFFIGIYFLISYLTIIVVHTEHINDMSSIYVIVSFVFVKHMLCLNNSYIIYIIRNPILWLGKSAYGGGVFVSLFFDRRCSPDYCFRNVNKMAAWIPDNKKR